MKRYRYIEIAPTRHPADAAYGVWENVETKQLIYRKIIKLGATPKPKTASEPVEKYIQLTLNI